MVLIGGYKVVNAKYNGTDVTIAANKGVTTALALANNTSVKFNTIATTRTDGYKVFTDTQIAEGFKMTFNGKDALFGEKALYAIDDNATKTIEGFNQRGEFNRSLSGKNKGSGKIILLNLCKVLRIM